jgi:arylsulfatase A-like enzyme
MNIIFILLDDLGWNDIGVNNSKIDTPNICEISSEGCVLDRNYAFHVCGPTRAMIQTGVYAYKYGMQQLLSPWNYYGLDSNFRLIPQYLSNLGYESFAIGKWHLGHNDKKWLPNNRGYKMHYGNLTGCVDHTTHLNCSTNIHDFSCNAKPIYEEGHFCDLFTNKTIETIEENKNKKFFIYLAYNSPHTPHKCPNVFEKKYSGNKKTYYGMISHLDHNLGKIFSKLKELKIYDDTMIWIQSDNGGWTINKGDNYPLRNGKASVYEGGIKVFTVIKNTNIKTKRFKGICHSVDVLPTLVEFGGGNPNEINLDGISIKENLINNYRAKRTLVISFYSEKFWCFIINNLKFLNENNKMECYDLEKDPEEKINIIEKQYEIFKDEIKKLICDCENNYTADPFLHEDQESIRKKCKDIKFWGQKIKTKNKSEIKLQSRLDLDKKKTFLELSGYDIFY